MVAPRITTLPATTRRRAKRAGQSGFTLIELLVALTVLLIGISGILAIQITSFRSASYTRHATEATVLAEDKMEALRTIAAASLQDGTETVDAQANLDPDGIYTREWSVVPVALTYQITVTVRWMERGNEPHAIVLTTQRGQ